MMVRYLIIYICSLKLVIFVVCTAPSDLSDPQLPTKVEDVSSCIVVEAKPRAAMQI